MDLATRYNSAAEDSYVGRVRKKQAADAGAIAGVDFMDGQQKTGSTPEDKYQTEFKRNAEGTFKYGKAGQNGQSPGTDGDTTGTKGLSRWTADALNIAFKKAGAGLESIWNSKKAFKSAQTVKWTDPTDPKTVYDSYHRWIPAGNFTTSLSNTAPASGGMSTRSRVLSTPKGPSPA